MVRGARLGVDVGSVRVGLASSDPDGLIATPVETVPRDKGRVAHGALPTDVTRIVDEVCERGAAVVYVGLPRHLSGSEGASSAAARAYAVTLAQAIAPVSVWLVDERLSTVTAHQVLHASGMSGRRHRTVVDQAAAVVILQAALDAERVTGQRSGELVAVDHDVPGGREGTGGAHDETRRHDTVGNPHDRTEGRPDE